MLCAAIPYRKAPDGAFEILLVTSRGKGNWILPKGKVKPGKTAAVSAQEELYEEAGARGILDQAIVSRCNLICGQSESKQEMQIFSVEVGALSITWPEMFERKRRWVYLHEAVGLVKGNHYRTALRKFASVMRPVA